ncbi:uncharacterized protein METZ01_LOCUS159103, partial [marine metagenome]
MYEGINLAEDDAGNSDAEFRGLHCADHAGLPGNGLAYYLIRHAHQPSSLSKFHIRTINVNTTAGRHINVDVQVGATDGVRSKRNPSLSEAILH